MICLVIHLFGRRCGQTRRRLEGVKERRIMKCLLGAMFSRVVADGIISQFLVAEGLGREGNPFLQAFIGRDYFLWVKVGGALLCVLLLWDVYKRWPRIARIFSLCIVAFYTVIVYWNLSIVLVQV